MKTTGTSSLVSRRSLLLSGAAGLVVAACSPVNAASTQTGAADAADAFADAEVRSWSEDVWKERLDAASYRVLRKAATERPFSSSLNEEKRAGAFHCKGCDLPLFDAATKYDSRTGWPSFFDVIKENIGTVTDYKIGYPRTEYHCARCLGHQGHVFPDGPRPTGLRYCNNGLALTFVPA